MKVGFSKVCITPELGVELAGFGSYLKRQATGVELDLFARALAIEQGGVRAAIVVCDLIGLLPEISQFIETEAARRNRINPDLVLIACTHTHTGPATNNAIGCGEFDPAYLASIGETIVSVIDAAFVARSEVTGVTMNAGAFSNTFAHNRQIYENPNIDDTVRTVRIEREGEKPLALVNYSCHPVSAEASSIISSDFPGFVCQHFENAGFDAVYINGFSGNINPFDKGKAGCAVNAGKLLFDVAFSLIQSGQEVSPDPIYGCGGFVPLALRQESSDAIDAPYEFWMKVGHPEHARVMAVRSHCLARKRITATPFTDFLPYKALRLGNLLFVFHSAEVCIEYGKRLQAAFPNYFVLFAGVSFGTTRYLPTTEMLEKGNETYVYEAIDACHWYGVFPADFGAPETHFEAIIEQIKTIL